MSDDRLEELDEASDLIEEAIESLGMTYDLLKKVARICERNARYFDYNISGNMEVYVINHIGGSYDSMFDKLNKYKEEISEAKNPEYPEEFYEDVPER